MPRSIWNGTITFGMVNVPVKLYSATESKSIHFHEVHVRDGSRIEHRRLCSKESTEVPYKEVVKGYEVSPGKYVVLENDEAKAAAGDRGKVVHIEEFVEAAGIDPVCFEKTYYVGSRDDKDAYRLLLHTMRYADEVVSGDELDVNRPSRKPSKREVAMAARLIDSMQQEFDAGDYEDTYRKAVLVLLKRKAAGKDIDLNAEEEPEHGDDLLAALQASVGS